MSIENARIDECPAKPITHAFICFKDNDEMKKYVRSANVLRKALRGRKIKISRSMNENQMLHSHETQHSSQFDFIELDVKIRVG